MNTLMHVLSSREKGSFAGAGSNFLEMTGKRDYESGDTEKGGEKMIWTAVP
jgi:hypothetical protein